MTAAIPAHIRRIRQQMADACRCAGRPPESVRLLGYDKQKESV